jgi:hypothetical protein
MNLNITPLSSENVGVPILDHIKKSNTTKKVKQTQNKYW